MCTPFSWDGVNYLHSSCMVLLHSMVLCSGFVADTGLVTHKKLALTEQTSIVSRVRDITWVGKKLIEGQLKGWHQLTKRISVKYSATLTLRNWRGSFSKSKCCLGTGYHYQSICGRWWVDAFVFIFLHPLVNLFLSQPLCFLFLFSVPSCFGRIKQKATWTLSCWPC